MKFLYSLFWVLVISLLAVVFLLALECSCRSVVPVTVQQFQIQCEQTGTTESGKQVFRCVENKTDGSVTSPDTSGDDKIQGAVIRPPDARVN